MALLVVDEKSDQALGELVRRGVAKSKTEALKKSLDTLGGVTTDENEVAGWKQAIDAANKSNSSDTVKMLLEQEFLESLLENRRDRKSGKNKNTEEDDDMGNGMIQMMMMMMQQQQQAADRQMQMQMQQQQQQQRDAMFQRIAQAPGADAGSKTEILEYIKMADERTEKLLAAGREETSKQQQLQIGNKHHDDLMTQFQAMNDASNDRVEKMMSQHAADMEHLDERLRRLQDNPKGKTASEDPLDDIPLRKAREVRKKLEEAGAMPPEQTVDDRLRLDREARKGTQETTLMSAGLEELKALRQTADHTFRTGLSMIQQQQPAALAQAGTSTQPLQNARSEQERAAAYAEIQAKLQQAQQPEQPQATAPAAGPIESVALQRPSAPSVPVPTAPPAEAVPANGPQG